MDKEIYTLNYKSPKVVIEKRTTAVGHSYWVSVDGSKPERKTGVTTHIGSLDKSAGLMSWQKDMIRDALLDVYTLKGAILPDDVYANIDTATEQKEKAADIGSQIHEWIEHRIKAKLNRPGAKMPGMPKEKAVQIGVNAWLDFEGKHKIEFVDSERPVYSVRHGYSGTLDALAVVDGKLGLLDIKSSNGLYNSILMQTAAYQKGREEEGDLKIETRWAVRVAKETEDEYVARITRRYHAKGDQYIKTYLEKKPYMVLEDMCLDAYPVDRDFSSYLAIKGVHEWNKSTDFFTNGKLATTRP